MRLRLKEQKGPRRAPPPLVSGVGDLTWEPSKLPGLERVRQTPSSPLLLLLSRRAPPTCLSRSPWPPSYAPRTHMAWRGLWRAGDWPGSSAGSPGQVGQAISLFTSPAPPRGPLPPTSPDLPSLRGADPVWPPLLLPSLSPYILLVHLGVPPISLGVRVPHQQPAGTLVVGRH